MPRIFISHSSRDNAEARLLINWLRDNGFEELFLDIDKHAGIQPGMDWERKLYAEVSRSTAVVLLLTKNWHESKWCFVEFAQARALVKDIIPVLVTADGEQFIGDSLQKINLAENRDEALERLLGRLHQIGRRGPDGFSLPPGRPPFPGLLSFDRDDAAIYFGRADLVGDNLDALEQLRRRGGERFLLLHGESGSGKSSLLKAGLLPQIDRRGSDWLCLPVFRPGPSPASELRASLLTALGSDHRLAIDLLLNEPTLDHARSIVDTLHHAHENHQATVLLAIDQLEELLTLAPAPERAHFVRILQALLDPSLRMLAVATVRTAELSSMHDALGLAIRDQLISPFPLDRLPEIIRKPAQVVGLAVDDRLVAAIVRDAGTTDMLPLVAFLLRQLFDRHGSDHRLTLEEYQSLGDARAGLTPLEACVRTAADRAIDRVKPTEAELKALRETFVPGLVRVDDRGKFLRQPLPADRISVDAMRLIEALVEDRLLVRRGSTVDVAHEALFNVWPFLRELLAEEFEFLQGMTQLAAAIDDWRRSDPVSCEQALLTGVRLSRNETWLARYPARFDYEQRAFITASITARDQAIARRRRLQRNVLIASLAAVVVFAALGGFAWTQRNSAETQRAEAVRQRSVTDAANKSLEVQLYFRRITEAERDISIRETPHAIKLLEECPPELRGWEWGYLMGRVDRDDVLLNPKSKGIWMADFSPDGSQIATAGLDGKLRLWDAQTGSSRRVINASPAPILPKVLQGYGAEGLLRILSSDPAPITCVSFSPDGNIIATGSISAAIESYDFGKRLAIFDRQRSQGIVTLWDARSGIKLANLSDLPGVVLSLAFSPDGQTIVASSINPEKIMFVWDVSKRRPLRMLSGHKGTVHRMRFSPDGRTLVSSDTTGTMRVWRTSDFSTQAIIHGHEGPIIDLAFAPDGTRLATASEDSKISLWDTASWKRVLDLRGHQGSALGVTYSSDGKLIASAGYDRTVRIWDAETGQPRIALRGHDETVWSVAFSPDGKKLVSASFDGTARIWDAARSPRPVTPGEFSTGLHTDRINGVQFSPDGALLASSSWDRTVQLVDARTGKLVHELKGFDGPIWGLSFDPSSQYLATACWDLKVRIWDARKGKLVRELKDQHTQPIHSVAYSRSGNLLASGSWDGDIKIWKPDDGSVVATGRGFIHPVFALAFSPSDKILVSGGGDRLLKVWNPKTGELLQAIRSHEASIYSLSFSPDGKYIATAGWDRVIKVWAVTGDIVSPEPLYTLKGHLDRVSGVAFSNDGKMLASSSEDNTVRFWDTASGKPLGTHEVNRGMTWSLSFSPDDERIAIGCWYLPGALKVWKFARNLNSD